MSIMSISIKSTFIHVSIVRVEQIANSFLLMHFNKKNRKFNYNNFLIIVDVIVSLKIYKS